MTKNDITRGLIDFAVSQCLKNIKEDPYRSIRRLADLGRQFAKGRFQEELFSLFQRLLLNEDGPYYEMLKQLVSSVDTDSLKTLGINIGYNSWTCGASRICEVLDCDLSDLIEYIPNKQKKTGRNLILEEHGNRKRKGV